jgi:ketosteroid isomerase-like protein
VSIISDALKLSFDTGERGPFSACLAPGCVTWHNSDKLETVTADTDGGAILHRLVDGIRVDFVQHEVFETGEMIRFVLRGTIKATGSPFEVHNCLVLSTTSAGVTRIDEYVDPTLYSQFAPAS